MLGKVLTRILPAVSIKCLITLEGHEDAFACVQHFNLAHYCTTARADEKLAISAAADSNRPWCRLKIQRAAKFN
jgi:hypothetical protein